MPRINRDDLFLLHHSSKLRIRTKLQAEALYNLHGSWHAGNVLQMCEPHTDENGFGMYQEFRQILVLFALSYIGWEHSLLQSFKENPSNNTVF